MSLDELEHRRIFEERIVRREFDGARASASPTVVLMGGQPGSGKSGLLDVATDHLSVPGGRAVQIVGDDLRDYHPDYPRLLEDDDRSAAAATDLDSGRWVAMCLVHVREHRYSAVVEGTMRDPTVPLATATAFRHAGYRVEAWVMAVDPLSSQLGILARYHEQRAALGYGRFTIPSVHDAAVAGVLESADALQDSRAVDRIIVAARGPTMIADVPGTAATPRIRHLVEEERTRPWTPREVKDFVRRADRIAAVLPSTHDHRRLLADLKAAAIERGSGHGKSAVRQVVVTRPDLRGARPPGQGVGQPGPLRSGRSASDLER